MMNVSSNRHQRKTSVAKPPKNVSTSSLLYAIILVAFVSSRSLCFLSDAVPCYVPVQFPSHVITAVVRPREWTCHGRSQQEMVSKLTQAGIIKSQLVRDCLTKVDRSNYIRYKDGAYDDSPASIGYGQTISAPHMHAHALEELLPALERAASLKDEGKQISVLDVGCGSGYLTACLGRLVSSSKSPPGVHAHNKVYGIDFLPELVAFAEENAKKADSDLITSDIIEFRIGDGWKGLPAEAPFDAIHVGAAADAFPRNLMMQLTKGGILICPVSGPTDGGFQYLYRIERLKASAEFHESDFAIKRLMGVRYVPLVHDTRH